jgi:hypothetical protein
LLKVNDMVVALSLWYPSVLDSGGWSYVLEKQKRCVYEDEKSLVSCIMFVNSFTIFPSLMFFVIIVLFYSLFSRDYCALLPMMMLLRTYILVYSAT